MRQEFSKSVKREALRRSGGFCRCRARFAVAGVSFDHIIADSIGGEPTLENCQPLCLKCHKAKTAKLDTPRAAKAKRQFDKNAGIRSTKRAWPKRAMNPRRTDNTKQIYEEF